MFEKVPLHLLWFVPALLSGACTPTADPTSPSKPPPVTETSPTSPAMTNAKEIAADAPLEPGHVVFEGMVTPTKDGYYVRGVVVDNDLLPKALANAPGADAKNKDWFLGAIVRITGNVHKHEESPPSKDGIIEQRRSGTWFQVTRLDSASVVKPAEMIEGPLHRSKGFFTVAGKLISREDVAWSLSSNAPQDGDKVRFYGQSRTVVCEPNAQCLMEGSLPLFDVGRAERLP